MKDWMDEFKKRNALWIHDGNMRRPHALLTSGMHSNGFFNSRPVISDEPLLREAASDLIDLYRMDTNGFSISVVDRIIGPQTGATHLAGFMSCHGKSLGWSTDWASPAKDGEGRNKKMVFNNYEHSMLRGETVLLCEDVITTGESIQLTAKAVIEAGGMILPYVLALVNRSDLKEVGGRKILALVDRPMPTWTEKECPLCKDGSEPLPPKDNWKLLNA